VGVAGANERSTPAPAYPGRVQGRATIRGAGSSVLRAPVEARTWLALLYLLSSFVVGVAWFCVIVTGLATGVALSILWVGIPLVGATIMAWRWGARLERRWIGATLGNAIADPYQPLPEGSRRRRWRVIVHDPATWKDLAYLLLLFPLGVLWSAIVVTVWTAAVGLLTLPFWYWTLPDGRAEIFSTGGDDAIFVVDGVGSALVAALVGLLLIPVAALVTRVVAGAHGCLAQGLLGASRGQLEARVKQLADARSRAVDHAGAERRRIERDLHDGAQQRLVALAMGLGLAREKLATDPAAAGVLVAEAHEEAKRALADLRDLARGIHPAILTEQGLDPALSALAARSPVPVEVEVSVGRLSAALEAAAYFIVAEALANVAKHASASRALVRVYRDGSLVVVEIEDDGTGGADENGNGLSGLADRAAAVEGRVAVSSPVGGPTLIRAELPCAS
jgi:signal transduction histidine kinase